MHTMDKENQSTISWFENERFDGIRRLYTPRQVDEQCGSIEIDYTIARKAAEAFYRRLRTLFSERRQITTFGPYSPGQAVTMKRMGIEAIYLGGWATSAKGSVTEDPGPDLASYPLSQVPDEAATVVRALITADRNQSFSRMRMSKTERAATPVMDFRPFIVADADTGHGGDAHVRNLIRRFVEVGVPGYHIEDQKPGAKKCGHQGGKVLVPPDEQIKRLNAARFQLDVMRVPGIIVARTDAEAATLLDSRSDERDDPFIVGATNTALPSFKVSYIALMNWLFDHGVHAINGHLLYDVQKERMASALDWLNEIGLIRDVELRLRELRAGEGEGIEAFWDETTKRFSEAWSAAAGLKTFGEAVADVIQFRLDEGMPVEMAVDDWRVFAGSASHTEARREAKKMGVDIPWDCELPRTPEGFYQIQGGIDCAIARSLACAPYADLLWMETKTANLADAAKFAEGIHAVFPDKMLAYNLSPSFNWDTTGMSEIEMSRFPTELGKLGFVFNFITYGGHQIDGLAAEEFATALKEDGMLALARLQRRLRLLNSSYRMPQSHVGGPRVDAALMASSGRTTSTKAMGKGSTQFQHVIQTEVPPKLLDEWIGIWKRHHGIRAPWTVSLRPHQAGSDLLVLSVLEDGGGKVADIVFATIKDRRGRSILSVRDQNNHKPEVRRLRLMTLLHLFLVHRYRAFSVHYVSPTDDNQLQAQEMKSFGFYDEVNSEIGHIIVARVNVAKISQWTEKDQTALKDLIFHSAEGEHPKNVVT